MLGTETIDSVRNLGHVAWTDPSAKLEHMKGHEWQQLLKDEKQNFRRAATDPDVQVRIPAFKASLIEAKKAITSVAWFNMWTSIRGSSELVPAIHISPNGGGGSIRWAYKNERRTQVADDIDIEGGRIESLSDLLVYTITDVGHGSEDFKLTCQQMGRNEIWSKNDVGPQVATIMDRVYYLRHKKRLWYYRLCSCNKYDGSDERVEYELNDPHYNLSLIKTSYRKLFLKADNNGYSMLFDINTSSDGVHVERIDEDSIWQIPCGNIYGSPVRIVLTTGGEWQVRMLSSREIIPRAFLETYGEPYFYDFSRQIVLTRKNGIIYILRLKSWSHVPERIKVIAGGQVTPDIYSNFTDPGVMYLKVLIEDPTKAPYSMYLGVQDEDLHLESPYKGANTNYFNRIRVRSADGKDVYAGYVSRGGKPPRGLLVVIYGAYGTPTIIGSVMTKWGPLLESGWAIGFAYVRGGGDNGWDWAEAGRRDQRFKSLEDAEACIAGLQWRLRVSPANTIIYGRSAGGIQVGALANRNPRGNLFRGIYCEVPYLDVLQTTTNPSLPLTELEYDEFGDPRHRLADLSFWVRHSPVTNVPANGLPNIMILCRTGLNDTQVYAYEPIKWILKARGQSPAAAARGMPKLLGIESDEGHFYSGPKEIDARATDLAILDAFIGSYP